MRRIFWYLDRHVWVFGLLLGTVFSFIFLWSMYIHIGQIPGRDHLDYFLAITMVQHWIGVALGNWHHVTELPSMYGIANTAFSTDHHLLQAISAFPLYLLTRNIVVSINILSILTMIVSVAAMYVWCFFLTDGAFWPSIIGALIFVYNPYVFARYPDQVILYTLWPIPLAFLCFEKAIRKPTNGTLFGFFFFLTLELLSSLYYAAYMAVIVPIYVVVRVWQTKMKLEKLSRWGAWLGFVILIVLTIVSVVLYKRSTGVAPRSSEEIEYFYAAWPVDWLFTNTAFVFWGSVGSWLSGFFGTVLRAGSRDEMSLFPGLTAIVLFFLSFWTVKSTRERRWWKTALALVVLSFILSLGPRIHLSLTMSFPNLVHQLIAWVDPLIGYMRATERWAVMVMFFGASMVSVGFAHLKVGRHVSSFLSVLVCLLLVFEYSKFPMDTTVVSPETVRFYQVLTDDRYIRTIVDLPIGNDLPQQYPESRLDFLDARYLLWAATYHHKQLLNGYTSFMPTELLNRGKLLSVNFPTMGKLTLLRSWGVDAIVLHRDEFNDPAEFDRIASGLQQLGVPEIEKTDNLALFTISAMNP